VNYNYIVHWLTSYACATSFTKSEAANEVLAEQNASQE